MGGMTVRPVVRAQRPSACAALVIRASRRQVRSSMSRQASSSIGPGQLPTRRADLIGLETAAADRSRQTRNQLQDMPMTRGLDFLACKSDRYASL